MSLKRRLLLILIFSGLLLAVFLHFSINTTIIPDLEEQKAIIFHSLENRIRAVLSSEDQAISQLCDHWSRWQGLGDYVRQPSQTFIGEYLSDSSIFSHRLNLILITAPDNRFLFTRVFREDLKFLPYTSLKVEQGLEQLFKWARQGQRARGILNSAYGPILVAAAPIEPVKPGATAVVVLGRFLDNKRLPGLANTPGQNIRITTFKETELFEFYLKQMQDKVFFYREDKKRLTLLFLVKDILGNPSLILRLETSHELLWVAEQHTQSYIIISTFSLFLMGILVYFMIGRYINRRIISITRETQNVQGLKDISRRITHDQYRDEISSLIHNINQMLDKIEIEKQQREEIEQQLITNEKLVSIGRLSASIAHEINNPVLAISNCLQALKRTCKQCDGEDYKIHHQAIGLSETEIKRVRTIISNLLDFHRMDKVEFRDVNLDDILVQSLEIVKWSKQFSAIKIITPKKKHFITTGSQDKLKQVFLNFITNAIDAIDDQKGELRIEMQRSPVDGYCDIHFKDNGSGIPENIRNHLFEPFISSKQEKGVGLGLYVSYKIIQNHKGDIIFQDNDGSTATGTHFIIRLPLKEEKRA
jgi:signal transduction histidine kinase